MWSSYDEDLNDNPFFQELTKNHSDILTRAAEESWILCVPCTGTMDTCDFSMDSILDHVLVPNSQGSYLQTLSKKQLISVKNKRIHDRPDHSIKILFEETFYVDNNSKKYTAWCTNGPLFANHAVCSHRPGGTALSSLHDCIDYLWSQNAGPALESMRALCWKFIETNPEFDLETLQSQKELVGGLYSQCLQKVLRDRNSMSSSAVEVFKLAVETFMQSCLERTLIKAINTQTWRSDCHLNKTIRNHSAIQLRDLNISRKYCDVITNAKCQLTKLNNYVTILDKLHVLRLTFDCLCEDNCMTSDDVLQIFVFLILKLNVNNWVSNLVYLSQFRFSSLDNSDRNGYLMTSLEAAIEFIKARSHFCCGNLAKGGARFEAVQSGDVEKFRELSEARSEVCHPLCTCEKCSKRDVINDSGQTLLIYATILNKVDFVEILINAGDVDAKDNQGRSALHYAAAKGFQDVLLVLINSKADVNLPDNDGNTALHLSSLNGHDNCVKALLYTCKTLEVDAQNKNGDTALMLAMRSCFLEIARALLESHACISIANRKNQTVGRFANNYYAEKLLLQFNCNTTSSHNQSFNNESSNHSNNANSSLSDLDLSNGCSNEHGTKPKSLKQYKRLELLMRTIENNDLPLFNFYLGFRSNPASKDLSFKCHPLCDCCRCEDLLREEPQPHHQQQPAEKVINVNLCNGEGVTPLHLAAKCGRTEMVRTLLDSRAVPNLRTYKTLQTPLHLACMNQRLPVARELVNCGGCQIDLKDYLGYTPLYYACVRNDARTVEILLDNGADPESKNWQGFSILKEVQDRRLFGIAKLLTERRLSAGDDSDDEFL